MPITRKGDEKSFKGYPFMPQTNIPRHFCNLTKYQSLCGTTSSSCPHVLTWKIVTTHVKEPSITTTHPGTPKSLGIEKSISIKKVGNSNWMMRNWVFAWHHGVHKFVCSKYSSPNPTSNYLLPTLFFFSGRRKPNSIMPWG